jgi:hypothetical protein
MVWIPTLMVSLLNLSTDVPPMKNGMSKSNETQTMMTTNVTQ